MSDLSRFRGRRGAIWRELGEEEGARLLHKRYEGNLTAATEFLGYSTRNALRTRWQRYGLDVHGRDAPRRGNSYRRFDDERDLDDWRREYLALSEAEEHAYEYRWTVPRGTDEVLLVPISDLQFGASACDYSRFLHLRDWIGENPPCRWFLGGDNFDLATVSGPGRSSEQFMPLSVAQDMLTEDLSPIAAQGVAIFDGNHDVRIALREDVDWSPSRDLAQRLGLPALGLQGFIVYRLVVAGREKQRYSHYHHHGVGAARTPGAKLNRARDIAANTTAELVTVGHLHQELAAEYIRREASADGVVRDVHQRVVQLPAFLKYRGYPADQALPPASLGVSGIWLGVREHRIHQRQ